MDKKGEKRPRLRLGRGGRTAVNLVLALALLFSLWARFDYPLPAETLRLRRTERENLLARPTEIQARVERGEEIWLAGANGELAVLYWDRGGQMFFYDRRAGGTLMFLGDWASIPEEAPGVLAVDGPEGAVAARLTLRVQGEGYVHVSGSHGNAAYGRALTRPDPKGRDHLVFDETYEVRGESVGTRGFFFPLEWRCPDGGTQKGYLERCLLGAMTMNRAWGYGSNSNVNWRMEVSFYDEVGDLLGTAARADWIDGAPPSAGAETIR